MTKKRKKNYDIDFKTATSEEMNAYFLEIARNYKPSGKNDPLLVIRRERGHRN